MIEVSSTHQIILEREVLGGDNMIIGDPQIFAVWIDQVDAWSTAKFSNGCLAYIVEEHMYPQQPFLSTIGSDIASMANFTCLEKAVGDGNLAAKGPQEVFESLCALAFPGMNSNAKFSDYTHLVSPLSILDAGYAFFLLQEEGDDRLVFGDLAKQSGACEVRLPKDMFMTVIQQAIGQWKATINREKA